MTNTGADMRTMTLEKGLATFLNALTGKNRSAATLRAYQTDIAQFISFLHANNVSIHSPAEVQKIDVMEYLSLLAKRELTGIARARKMSAIREYFRFLEGIAVITKSPTTGIETPKREKNGRQVLRPDEYTKMLSLAGANPRDGEPCASKGASTVRRGGHAIPKGQRSLLYRLASEERYSITSIFSISVGFCIDTLFAWRNEIN